jgi:glycosyltransferase involved in cell wall biosynthesis
MTSNQRPAISVLVPSLNSGRYLGEALKSVFKSELPIEVIVQDGGSTDNTQDVVAAFEDNRIRLIVEPDDGQADALNRALSLAQGDFVLWLNADDIVDAEGLRAAVDAAQGVDLVYGGSGLIDRGGRRLKTYLPRSLDYHECFRRGTYIFSGSLLIRRSLLQRLGGFALLDYCMDFDLLLKLARSRPSDRMIEQGIGFLRVHPESKGERVPWSFFREHWQVAWQERPPGRRMSAVVILAQMKMGAYILTRPVWRSRAWRRMRPAKRR